MDIFGAKTPGETVSANEYPGRGIITGMTPDGLTGVAAYFIMGRSANSRNRIFVKKNGAVFTEPFDPSKVEDPSLIIYAAVREQGNTLIVTNGDQTDTVAEGLRDGKSFSEALESRCFEPDSPNFTPRISSISYFGNGAYRYEMSILKSIDANGSGCARYTFSYPPTAGLGHFIHTYNCNGNPLPSFSGEPKPVRVLQDIDGFTKDLWENLDDANRISLYVRYTDILTGGIRERIVNKNV